MRHVLPQLGENSRLKLFLFGWILLSAWVLLVRTWWHDTTIAVHPLTHWIAAACALVPAALCLWEWFKPAEPTRTPQWNIKRDRLGLWGAYGIGWALIVGNLYFWPIRGTLEVLTQASPYVRTTQMISVVSIRYAHSTKALCEAKIHIRGEIEGEICVRTWLGGSIIDLDSLESGQHLLAEIRYTRFSTYVAKLEQLPHGA